MLPPCALIKNRHVIDLSTIIDIRRAMEDPDVPPEQKICLLRESVKRHQVCCIVHPYKIPFLELYFLFI